MRKKILTVLLVLCLAVGLLPAGAGGLETQPLYYREVEWNPDAQAWGDPGALTAMDDYMLPADWNRMLIFCDADGNTLAGTPAVEDTGVFSLEEDRVVQGGWLLTGVAVGQTMISVEVGSVSYRAGIRCVTVDEFLGNQGGHDDPRPGDDACRRETFELNETAYSVGFGFEREDDVLNLYEQGNSGPSVSYTPENGPGVYGGSGWDRFDFNLYAALVEGQEGINTIFRKKDLEFSVRSLTLTAVSGDADAFSLEPGTTQVTAAAAPSASGCVYYDRSHTGAAKLTAVVTVGGEDYTVWVTFTCSAIGTDTIDCSGMATIQEVNGALAQAGRSSGKVEIVFGAHEYAAGTDGVTVITIPNLTSCREPDAITIRGERNNVSETVLKGGISYEAEQGGRIEDVSFAAPAEGSGTGLTGITGAGGCGVYRCCFTGFATAIDSTKSFIGATEGNSFTGNTIAVHISLPEGNSNQDQWSFNRFIRNGTAVKVDRLNSFITPYYFRLRDSDFICNTTDFDIVPGGDYYFYRNYFYCEAENSLRAPQVAEGTTVPHCYPARAHSIAEGRDELIYGEENTVLNSLSGELLVSEIAEGTTIDVVEDDGTGAALLAIWAFVPAEGGNNG